MAFNTRIVVDMEKFQLEANLNSRPYARTTLKKIYKWSSISIFTLNMIMYASGRYYENRLELPGI